MDNHIALVAYAVQSKGPVPSGLMLEGSAHLAGRLASQGYRPTIFDYNNVKTVEEIARHGKQEFLESTIEELGDYIDKTGTKIIAFTAYNNGFRDEVQIAEAIKKRHPSIVLALGGPLPGWFGQAVYDHTDVFDILVQGEGDKAIVEIANAVHESRGFGNVPNAFYKTPNGIVKNPKQHIGMSKLPFPIYDSEVYLNIEEKMKIATLRTSVGCRHGKCTFCIQPRLDGKFRERDIEDVLAEIEYAQSLGINKFRLSDPNPTPQRIRELIDQTGNITFASFGYADSNYDLTGAKGKLISLFYGVEALEPSLLARINKAGHADQYQEKVFEAIADARKNGVSTIYANIIPFPDDTTERIADEVDRVVEINPDFITVLPLSPMPGTVEFHRGRTNPEKWGLKVDDDYMLRAMLFELDNLQATSLPEPPFQLRVDGEWVKNPFAAGLNFAQGVASKGIGIASDEIVLMAHHYYGGLENNALVLQFMAEIRSAMVNDDVASIKKKVVKINGQ